MLVLLISFIISLLKINANNPVGCITSTYDANFDYFPDKISLSTADNFTIEYFNSYKIIKTDAYTHSYYGAIPAQKLLLFQCGTPLPTSTLYDDYDKIEIPISNFGLYSSTFIPFIEVLGHRTNITGVNGKSYISSPCLISEFSNIQELSDSSTYSMNVTAANVSDAQVIFTSTTLESDNNAGAKLVAVPEHQELELNGVVEYLKFFGAFLNKESEATALSNTIIDRVTCISNKQINSNIKTLTNKKIIWGYYSSWSGGWDLGECPNYYCEAISLAGATILEYKAILGGATRLLTDAEFKQVASTADIFIYTDTYTTWNSLYAANKVLLDQIPAVQNKLVFGVHGQGSNDWFEGRILEPDVLIEDLLSAIAMSESNLIVNHQPVWIVPIYLPSGEISNAGQYGRGSCIDVNEPKLLQADNCDNLMISLLEDAVEKDDDDDDNTIIVAVAVSLSVIIIILFSLQCYTFKRLKDEQIPFLPLSQNDAKVYSDGDGVDKNHD